MCDIWQQKKTHLHKVSSTSLLQMFSYLINSFETILYVVVALVWTHKSVNRNKSQEATRSVSSCFPVSAMHRHALSLSGSCWSNLSASFGKFGGYRYILCADLFSRDRHEIAPARRLKESGGRDKDFLLIREPEKLQRISFKQTRPTQSLYFFSPGPKLRCLLRGKTVKHAQDCPLWLSTSLRPAAEAHHTLGCTKQ